MGNSLVLLWLQKFQHGNKVEVVNGLKRANNDLITLAEGFNSTWYNVSLTALIAGSDGQFLGLVNKNSGSTNQLTNT